MKTAIFTKINGTWLVKVNTRVQHGERIVVNRRDGVVKSVVINQVQHKYKNSWYCTFTNASENYNPNFTDTLIEEDRNNPIPFDGPYIFRGKRNLTFEQLQQEMDHDKSVV